MTVTQGTTTGLTSHSLSLHLSSPRTSRVRIPVPTLSLGTPPSSKLHPLPRPRALYGIRSTTVQPSIILHFPNFTDSQRFLTQNPKSAESLALPPFRSFPTTHTRLLARASSGEKNTPGPDSASAENDKKRDAVGPTAETTPLVRLAWYASEAFGKAVAVFRQPGEDSATSAEALEKGRAAETLSREEAVKALREDYDKSYFVTGAMTMDLYEEECEFADPFVSFRGRERFKQNVSNLGSFMEDVNLNILDWQEEQDKVTTKWRFSCVLGLPWRPILAASGGTDHYFNKESGRIYKHVERWDISPVDGLKQLIKPNPKFRKQKK